MSVSTPFVVFHHRRRSWLFGVAGFLWLIVGAACGGKAPDTPASTPASQPAAPTASGEKKPRVALLSPGPISDDGWNAFGYDALKIIEKELGCEVRQQQVNDSPADREQGFRAFAQEGFDVVIGHGGEFTDQALAVAKDFPQTTFVVTAGDKAAPNVVSVVFDTGQASYLAGAIAAMMSKTGRAGAIGGQNIPASARNLYAFRNGARAINPKMDVMIAFIGSWTDTAAARQQALAMIDKGADFLIHDCDAAAAGVFQAVKERNIRAFGMQKDQSHLAPEHIVGSPTSNPQGLAEIVRRILQKEQKGEVVHLGIRDNAVGFAIKKGFIPKEIEGRLNGLTLAIQKGEIDVFKEQP
ncbi:BMP family protein [Chloracidobacterium aggregatum]|uniref:BMP family protein n=1 Tax=Chloracidobacterium sp. N TaxID=2821540 RepID=A0ABX8B1J1_9BACT|nr:BMP family protein [Chloracidobacterium aggregatum]QUV90154.1 BMP family protein [Chloracidobacterium sp. A]QUV93366.1 BMP family protein [Chloracidobacterium sp. N]QUV96522.1 BMP family protein [Chloracidobacterium sp. E]